MAPIAVTTKDTHQPVADDAMGKRIRTWRRGRGC
jgi:hypothetical protein